MDIRQFVQYVHQWTTADPAWQDFHLGPIPSTIIQAPQVPTNGGTKRGPKTSGDGNSVDQRGVQLVMEVTRWMVHSKKQNRMNDE